MRLIAISALVLAASTAAPLQASAQDQAVFTVENVGVDGNLDVDGVRRVIRRDLPQLRACYTAALSTSTDLAGVLALRFVVMADGGVGNASLNQVESSLAPVAACIRERALRWRFAVTANAEAAVVTTRFRVAPRAEAPPPAPTQASMASGSRVPPVRAGRVVVRGSLDRAIVHRVVRRQMRSVRTCYDQSLESTPTLRGRVHLRFTINARGAVVAAATTDIDEGFQRVAHCLTAVARRWTFPEPPGGGIVMVTYPFIFEPVSRSRVRSQ